MKRIQSDSASSNHDEGGVKRVLDRWLVQGMQGTLGVTTKREKKWDEDEIIDRAGYGSGCMAGWDVLNCWSIQRSRGGEFSAACLFLDGEMVKDILQRPALET